MASDNTKRIAKNSMALYFRMFLTLIISLFTSRIVLETLGVDDYGVYNVVGGVMSLFGFISASMGSATARFITFALGTKDLDKLKRTFSCALEVHILIALIVVFLGETVGLWFLNNKLNIPAESMAAARWIYQFSIFSAFMSITQAPYSACINAHEKMSVYAYFEILNVVLRLLIVFLLVFIEADKLILYGVLGFVVGIVMISVNRLYCIRKFRECRFKPYFDKGLFKSMFIFSGWDLYGNCSDIVRNTGVSMLINIFFGVAANAAIGIALNVRTAVGALTGNLVSAARPQIIKSYASGDYEYMIRLIMSMSRLVLLVLCTFAVPLIIEMEFVLHIWLGNVPGYAVNLSRLTVLFLFFSTLSYIACTGVHATGDLRRCNFINGSLYISVLPISWISFKYFGGTVYLPYALNAAFVLVGCLVNVYTVSLYVPQMSLMAYIKNVILKCFSVVAVVIAITLGVRYFLTPGWFELISVCAVFAPLMVVCGYLFLLDEAEKSLVKELLIKLRAKFCSYKTNQI